MVTIMRCKNWFWGIFAAGALLAGSLDLAARDVYVDNLAGDDHRNGASEDSRGLASGPCRSIARALYMAGPADRIIIKNTGEPYRESITLQGGKNSGTSEQKFQIIGNGAVLDGSESVMNGRWEFETGDIFSIELTRRSYQQLSLGDVRLVRHSNLAALRDLKPLEWTLLQGKLLFRVEEGKLPSSYDLRAGKWPVGITLYDVRNVVISDLVVRGFQLDGVNAHDLCSNVDLMGIAANDNGRAGIVVAGSSRVRVVSCEAKGNGESQLRVEGYCEATISGGTFDEATAPKLIHDGGRIKQAAAE